MIQNNLRTAAVLLAAGALAACADDPAGLAPRAQLDVSAASAAGAPIYGGTENDYQPSLIRRTAGGGLMIALERLAPRTNSGDLYVSTSGDGGATWTTPRLAVGGRLNERHPSLIQHPDGTFSLFFLQVDRKGAYTIHRATSPDGVTAAMARMVPEVPYTRSQPFFR